MFQKGGTEKGKRMRLEVSCKTYVAYKIKAKSVPIPHTVLSKNRLQSPDWHITTLPCKKTGQSASNRLFNLKGIIENNHL